MLARGLLEFVESVELALEELRELEYLEEEQRSETAQGRRKQTGFNPFGALGSGPAADLTQRTGGGTASLMGRRPVPATYP